MPAEEVGGCGEDAELGGLGEPVGFAAEEVHVVGDVQLGQFGVELVGVGDGDDGVGVAVQDEGGWKLGGGVGVVGRDKAAGDFDDGFDRGRVGQGGESEREKAAERDAYERDAAGVDSGACGDVDEGVADGGEPERDVEAIGERLQVGSNGAGAVEIVYRVDGDAEAGDDGGELVEPIVGVAAGTVQQQEGGVGGRGMRFKGVKADMFTAYREGGLHGRWMRL
jgi:hypothetical protein